MSIIMRVFLLLHYRQMRERMTWRKAHNYWKSMLWKYRCTQNRKITRN